MTKETPTPAQLREATLWRVVRAIHLRVLESVAGKATDREAVLERYHVEMESDVAVLNACLAESFRAGVQAVHTRLHGAEGVDHEMLDQTIEYARKAPE